MGAFSSFSTAPLGLVQAQHVQQAVALIGELHRVAAPADAHAHGALFAVHFLYQHVLRLATVPHGPKPRSFRFRCAGRAFRLPRFARQGAFQLHGLFGPVHRCELFGAHVPCINTGDHGWFTGMPRGEYTGVPQSLFGISSNSSSGLYSPLLRRKKIP
jgi:hypothetical protein